MRSTNICIYIIHPVSCIYTGVIIHFLSLTGITYIVTTMHIHHECCYGNYQSETNGLTPYPAIYNFFLINEYFSVYPAKLAVLIKFHE